MATSGDASGFIDTLIGKLALEPAFGQLLRDDPAAALRSVGFEPTAEALAAVADHDWETIADDSSVLTPARGGI